MNLNISNRWLESFEDGEPASLMTPRDQKILQSRQFLATPVVGNILTEPLENSIGQHSTSSNTTKAHRTKSSRY